ncbi:GNAT family N-acetyltransferase [Paenibacillus sp. Marseille-Q4541]|uniref:GNAT family N-acetyltransferase n=1 Tax=Paenibacillus sp. Marseille-Q4541 TaxID=2831522 RepID=UPI001BADD776|nr:GNAT family N-acetyltransferase [Paenibacillus sp. Marseille-Q4541]
MAFSYSIQINDKLEDHEVPGLRESVGWARRDEDYPALIDHCLLWGSARDESGRLVAFGYITGPGFAFEHGYMEDVIVHPDEQGKGLGKSLVRSLLWAAEGKGLSIVTVNYSKRHESFYKEAGFTPCGGAVWRAEEAEKE